MHHRHRDDDAAGECGFDMMICRNRVDPPASMHLQQNQWISPLSEILGNDYHVGFDILGLEES